MSANQPGILCMCVARFPPVTQIQNHKLSCAGINHVAFTDLTVDLKCERSAKAQLMSQSQAFSLPHTQKQPAFSENGSEISYTKLSHGRCVSASKYLHGSMWRGPEDSLCASCVGRSFAEGE